ncbi:hypothetical protein CVT26_004066 [Gymnopilus dilepis]|uniref:THH1/TOM1/TOM3 domain-containing protein n=1 Tax=Gymnopilus dilepis TaxID=231916 RepID=A0A409YMN9_9AGAR|nr:hypothetical protein CVT26_004066 [Gymnopilus dilepis]
MVFIKIPRQSPNYFMSTQSDPVSVQKSTISSEVNGTVLQGLLLEVTSDIDSNLSLIFSEQKIIWEPACSRSNLPSIFFYCFYVILFWYLVQAAFVEHSDTRETLYESIIGGSVWPVFVTGVITFVMAAVGDTIVIWRCFTIWGGSLRVIFLPALFHLGQVGTLQITIFWLADYSNTNSILFKVVDLTVIILRCAEHFDPTYSQGVLVDNLIAAQSFMTSATTLTATILIAYRIYSASKENVFGSTRKRLSKIMEVLVESAAVYSLAAVAQAVALVIPETYSNEIVVDLASAYTSILFIFISGVAPTILVARIAILEYTNEDTVIGVSVPLSGLHFNKEQEASLSTDSDWGSRETLHSLV